MQPLLFEMLLKEQMYTNKRRLYYHGKVSGDDRTKSHFDEFYLSTRKEYAFAYTKGKGSVEVYVLKDGANIFNMKCATDEAAFRKYCQITDNELKILFEKDPSEADFRKYCRDHCFASKIDFLKERDWSLIDDCVRQDLIMVVRNLGYDGYFNFEIDNEGLNWLHSHLRYSYYDKIPRSPAIAIFNPRCLIKVDEIPFEELYDRSHEIEWVKSSYIRAIDKNDFDMSVFIKRMKAQTFGLSESDIQDVIDTITDDDIAEATKMYEGYAHSLKKRFGNLHYIEP